MPHFPTADTTDPGNSGGSYTGGPMKIVHHTTEGSTYAAAKGAFSTHNSWPHFTVDSAGVHQHVDTSVASRALKNLPGGVETNRDGAVQIEVVGFAAHPKNLQTLQNLAALCRWIETTHGVPRIWPNGPPKTAVHGGDPGGHNRNAHVWDTQGGHYGHSQCPENSHWDPGYTSAELEIIMGMVTARVTLNGAAITTAGAYTDFANRAWALARPVLTAMGWTISSTQGQVLAVTKQGQSHVLPYRKRQNGQGEIMLKDLTLLPGVGVTWQAANRTAAIFA